MAQHAVPISRKTKHPLPKTIRCRFSGNCRLLNGTISRYGFSVVAQIFSIFVKYVDAA